MEDTIQKDGKRPGQPGAGAVRPAVSGTPDWLSGAIARSELVGPLAEETDFVADERGAASGGNGARPPAAPVGPMRSPDRKVSSGGALMLLRLGREEGIVAPGSSTRRDLARAAAAYPWFAGMLGSAWRARMLALPHPEPFRGGPWRNVLFACLELLNAGRECGAGAEGVLTGLLQAGLGPAPGVPPEMLLAAGDVLDAARASRALSGALPEASAALAEAYRIALLLAGQAPPGQAGGSGSGASGDGGALGAGGNGAARISGFAGLFRSAAGIRDAWAAFGRGLGLYREALASVAASGAARAFPGLALPLPESPGDFTELCLRNGGIWPAAAAEFYRSAVDAFASLGAAAGPLGPDVVRAALERLAAALAELGLPGEAEKLRGIAAELPASGSWEHASPLAAHLMKAFEAPKPLADEYLEPFDEDFVPAFHRRLRKGELDALAFPDGIPDPSAPAASRAAGADAAAPSGASVAADREGGGGQAPHGAPSGTSGPAAGGARPAPGPVFGHPFSSPPAKRAAPAFPEPSTDGIRRLVKTDELVEDMLSGGGIDAKEAKKIRQEARQAAQMAAAGGEELTDSEALATAERLEKRAGAAQEKAKERLWDRVDRLGDWNLELDPLAVEAADNMMEEGELDVASDLVTDAAGQPDKKARLPERRDRSPVEEFYGYLSGLARGSDPFAEAANEIGPGSRGGGARPDVSPAERVWRRLASAFRPGEGGRTSALEKLVIWLGFSTGRGFSVSPAGGGGLWREYSSGAGSEPPLPAWGDGPCSGLSILVFHGGEPRGVPGQPGQRNSGRAPDAPHGPAAGQAAPDPDVVPPGLAEALSAWWPGPGSVPLVILLSPVSGSARGAMRELAAAAGRDLAVLDPALMAALACAAPLDKQLRMEWLFSAGGVYGRYVPFSRYGSVAAPAVPGPAPLRAGAPVPGPLPSWAARGASGALVPYPLAEPAASRWILRKGGGTDLAKRVAAAGGVVRVEGAAGSGKSELLRAILNDPDAGGDWVCLMDWSDILPAEARDSGPLGAVLARAAEALELPDWDPARPPAENLAALEAAQGGRGRKGQSGRVTVMVDGADGLLDAVLDHPGDLELLRGIAVREGAMKLVLAGRSVTRRLERHPASPLSVLRDHEPIAMDATSLSRMIAGPLDAAGFVLKDSLAGRIMALSFWNPGAAAILTGAVLKETLAEIPPGSPPPFTVTSRAVRRAASDPGVAEAMRLVAVAPLERDAMLRAVALAAVSGPPGRRSSNSRPDVSLRQASGTLRSAWPAAFMDDDMKALGHYAEELGRAGFVTVDTSDGLRPRSCAHSRLLGGREAARKALAALGALPAPPDALLLTARRFLPPEDQDPWPPAPGPVPAPLPPAAPLPDALRDLSFTDSWGGRLLGAHLLRRDGGQDDRDGDPGTAALAGGKGGRGQGGRRSSRPATLSELAFPDPSPFTLLQEASFFDRPVFDFRRLCPTQAMGAARASRALSGLCAMERLSGASGALFVQFKARDRHSLSEAVRVVRDVDIAALDPSRPVCLVVDSLAPRSPGVPDPFETVSHAAANSGRGDDPLACRSVICLCSPEDALRNAASETGIFASQPAYPCRWSEAAVATLLAGWGADPKDAGPLHSRTGGWDSLVAHEARELAGLSGPRPVMPQEGTAAFPEELMEAVDSMKGRRPSKLEPLRDLCPGPQGSDRPGFRSPADVLVSLTVLVPDGEDNGDQLWSLDKRFR
ncbi:MAG: hypothetical protein LBT40_03705 [Deltaproteobacteria bacterium]|nr:hypothetical protein [Deltaproteobacteria bacterium]